MPTPPAVDNSLSWVVMDGTLLATAYWWRIDGHWHAAIEWYDGDVTLHGPYNRPMWTEIHADELRS